MRSVSIVAASVDSPEWSELFVKSIRKFTTEIEHEIIIIDNGSILQNLSWMIKQEDIRLIRLDRNYGHGAAIDIGTTLAKHQYICALDIDSHVQREGWTEDLIEIYEESPETRFIGCKGPDHKPLKPPLFFFEKRFIMDNNLSFKHVPGVSSDTAQKLFQDILDLGFSVQRFVPGVKVYDCSGDEFWIKDKATIFHSWYGTRFCENRPDRKKADIDGYKIEKYLENKVKVFNQSLVKEILEC